MPARSDRSHGRICVTLSWFGFARQQPPRQWQGYFTLWRKWLRARGGKKDWLFGRGRCVKSRMEKSEAVAERLNVVFGVAVRPARADERRRWDGLMAEHHYLGFKQFAGRGLRHVAEWRGHWVALVGWQSGAFKCGPRDRWLGWHRSVQFRRPHLIGNNTRFLVLPEAWGTWGLASRALSRSLRRLSADWREARGHPLELAETFVDPSLFRGTCYLASNWTPVGRTRGFARHNGRYTDAGGSSKEMYVRPLRPRARKRPRIGWESSAPCPVAPARAEAAGGRGGSRGVGRAEGVVGAVADGRAALAAGPLRGVAGLLARSD